CSEVCLHHSLKVRGLLKTPITRPLMIQSGYCPNHATSTSSTTQSPSTVTEPTTTVPATSPHPTPMHCQGNGPFVQQDINIVYELSADKIEIDKKIVSFIENSLLPAKYYQLPGYVNAPITQVLAAPFPQPDLYKKFDIIKTDYRKITDMGVLRGILDATVELDTTSQFNISGNAIVDGVNFFTNGTLQGARPGLRKTMIVIATSDAGVINATKAVNSIKPTSNVITIAIGNGALSLDSLSTDGFAYHIDNLDDPTAVSNTVANLSEKLLIQSGICPPVPTTFSTTLSSTNAQTSTTPVTTPHITTSASPTPPSCSGGNGPFVKQDISVVFEFSAARAPVDTKIADFIGKTLFPTDYYELPGQAGTPPVTQLLVAPFPNTTAYSSFGILRADYGALRDLGDVQAWLSAIGTFDEFQKISGDAIIEQDVQKSVFIIASSDAGVAAASAAVDTLKNSSTIVTIAVGSGAKTLDSLASSGFAFHISDLDDSAQTSNVTSDIASKLLLQSSYCPPIPTSTVLTSISTEEPSTFTTSTVTTSSIPMTTSYHCPKGILQDIAIVYEQSSSHGTLRDTIANFIESTLFESQEYLVSDTNGNIITQFLPTPYPIFNGGFIAPKYPVWRSKADFIDFISNMRNTYVSLANYTKETTIKDSLNVVKMATSDISRRKNLHSTLIVIGGGASDIGVSEVVAEDIKKAGTRIVVVATSNDEAFLQLSSGGPADQFIIQDVSNNGQWKAVAQNISRSLAETSAVCLPLPLVTVQPATTATTQPSSTTSSTIFTPTTSVCSGPRTLNEDIAVVYDLSSGNSPASPGQIVELIRDKLFDSSKYAHSLFAAVPFPSISSQIDLLTVVGYADFTVFRSLTQDTLPLWEGHSSFNSTISDGLLNVWRLNNGTLGQNHRRTGIPNTIIVIAKRDTDISKALPIAKYLQENSRILTLSIGENVKLAPLSSEKTSFTIGQIRNATEVASVAAEIFRTLTSCASVRST
uniref:VWFA domain-containing protein n=1 Tax=Steinernema glaseri TaxID=37863 RepID=A0A1I7ZLN9_9BILA